jgi:chorismate-pyruvate lyase
MQDSRPSNIRDIGVSAMDPFLRALLFTDGTVTRTLEVHTLSRVSIEVIEQTQSPASADVASYLRLPDGEELTKRRVSIDIGSTRSALWAESHIVPERLPPGFLRRLDEAPQGIGESLQEIQLETWREMLWFGLDSPADWACVVPPSPTELVVLRRLYRVITQGRPALLVSESFPLGQRAGVYHLRDLPDSQIPSIGNSRPASHALGLRQTASAKKPPTGCE